MPPPRRDLERTQHNIFVNREGPIETAKQASNSIPSDGCSLLVFYGPGGQGKTALCRHIQGILTKTERSNGKLRVAEIDLHGRDKTDPDRLLVWVRNGLAQAGVGTPAFDLAFAISWEANRAEEPFPTFRNAWLARTGDLVGESASDGVTALREMIEDSAETIPLLGPLVTRGANWAVSRGKKAWIERTRTHISYLYDGRELKKPYELSALMPWMLAQDLNHHLIDNSDDRFVLLIDEYERVFDHGGAGKRWFDNPFDDQLRQLVAETNGLLATFFTRERLPWENNPEWRDSLRERQYLLGGLEKKFADNWLVEEGVDEELIRLAMMKGAREDAREGALAYPLLLELQVSHWAAIRSKGLSPQPDHFTVEHPDFSGRCRELLNRVLRDYGEPWQLTLERLSVCHRFDEAAFDHAIENFGTGLPKDAFGQLESLSFMTCDDDGFLVMHRAVSDVLRAAMATDRRHESISVLLEHFETRARASSSREITENHFNALVEAIALRKMLGVEGFVTWLADLFEVFRIAAWSRSGERFWRDALDLLRDTLGEEHPDTATSYNNVAYNLDAQGRYEEAEPLLRKGLEIRARTLGEEHPSTATSYNNVASNLNAQGRYEEAEPLYQKGLEISARTLGEEHPSTATSYNNVAYNLDAQGRYEEAEPLYQKGLEIRARTLGEEHPDTATSYNNVAYNLDAQGRYEEAEPLYRKGLEIRARTLGEEHPSTATSYNNVASNLDAQGRYEEAEPLYRKGLEIRARTLGEEHPSTATSYNNVASNLDDQGRYEEAEPLYRKGLEIRARSLGEGHPDTAASYNNVASNLDAQGRYEEAEPLYRKGLEIRARTLGEEHPSTATSYNNVASNLNAQGRYEEAEPLYRKGLEIRARSLGEGHPDTAASYNNVASNLDDQGRYEEAEPLYRKGLEIRARTLGEEHPSTATSYNNVASNLDAQGRYEEAEPLFRKGLEIRARTLGEEHPDTATSYNNVAYNLNAQGRYEEAEPLFRKGLEIMEQALGPSHPRSQVLRKNLKLFLEQRGN